MVYEYKDITGKTIESVTLSGDKERIDFVFGDGTRKAYGVEGDCCSVSWIEHLEVPDDVKGATLTSVDDGDGVEAEDPDDKYDCLQVYNTTFHTNRGDIVLEYRNESNGYYGGYLIDLGVN